MALRVGTGGRLEVGGQEAVWIGLLSYERLPKRFMDLCGALFGVLLTWPLWLAVAIAIKLESPGPVFHIQDRVGLDGERFRFVKFRSMYVDAERRRQQLEHLNEADGVVFKIRRDPRITRVGRLLRKLSLDELPQLLNVINGDMSLVGPRPPLPKEVERYRPEDMVRLTVKPGITCIWQVSGRSDLGFDKWMEYDRQYVTTMSLQTDVSILLRTLPAVISTRGAY